MADTRPAAGICRGADGRPSAGALTARALTICAILVTSAARVLTRVIWSFLRQRACAPAEVAGAAAADALVRLGPAFVKCGQLLSTRVDVLPWYACQALARLYDRLPSMPAAAAAGMAPAALLAELDGGAQALIPIGAGSIACVYRARLRDGRSVALKVRRPGIGQTVACDLTLLRRGVSLLQRLPWLRGAPLAEIAAQIGGAIQQQLEFEREAGALQRLRENLQGMEGVRVPSVLGTYSGPDILAMDYIAGLCNDTVVRPAARTAAVRGLRAVYQMLFLDGFVHCDLHPGNLYPMPDGSIVIIDAGFSRVLTDTARRALARFFYYMSRGNGAACADVVLSTARAASARADPDGFRKSMIGLVAENTRLAVAEFDLVAFTIRLFAIQRAHGFYADPQFVFPILSLIVLEGTLRLMCPDLDFQAEAIPFVLRGLMR